jgi:dCMP deaminase
MNQWKHFKGDFIMIFPHKEKYFQYYQQIAILASQQSVAKRRQVGAVIVAQSGMMATGWNGTPAGFDNECEYAYLADKVTKPEVIHAERNAIDKMTRQGVSTENSILFVTTAPCMECAKSIATIGINSVYYRDNYHDFAGIDFLRKYGVNVHKFQVPADAL